MKSKSIKGISIDELNQALDSAIDSSFQPTLAVVFCSKQQDVQGVVDCLDVRGVTIFGCTTNGEFVDEEPQTGSWTALLLDMHPDHFTILLDEYPEQNYREVAAEVARKAKARFDQPAFVLALSDASVDGESVLQGISDVVGDEVNVFGGGAGDDYAFEETLVFTNTAISKCGIVTLVLDESNIEVGGIATCGWKAVGTEKIVTKSEGNHVYTIDNQPAVDITAKYGGLKNVSPDNKDMLVEMAANLPLQLQREKGDPVMRPGLVIDWEDRSFYTSGSVPEGSKVRFSIPPDWDVMNKVVEGVQKLKDNSMPDADALIVFSCAGRVLAFGPLMSEEIAGVKAVYDVPMVGMFSNAELGRATGGNLEMHNLTTCTIALKEK